VANRDDYQQPRDPEGHAYTGANPSGAPLYGGATTPGSRFGGQSLKAHGLRLMARVGRHMTGFAYRNLRRLEGHPEDDRRGPAGEPNRAAGAPPPHEFQSRH
jgi:hypothetical protein